jgi:hypothetical protein
MSAQANSSSSQPRSPDSSSNETENETENTSGDENDTNDSRTDTDRPALPLADLLTRETDRKFVGLTENDPQEYPDEVPPETRCSPETSRSFKDIIKVLPKASSGELWATNDFVETSGRVDTAAIRRVHGLDVDALESYTGSSIEDLAAASEADAVVRVYDHQDIVDDRRKALNALGYDVKFRWQIASDSYSIINPQEAYLPIISALQQRGETNPFGWVSYRDWGGLFKMVVICPSLRHVVSGDQEDIEDDVEEDGITIAVSNDSDSDEDSNKDEEGTASPSLLVTIATPMRTPTKTRKDRRPSSTAASRPGTTSEARRRSGRDLSSSSPTAGPSFPIWANGTHGGTTGKPRMPITNAVRAVSRLASGGALSTTTSTLG